MVIRDYVTVTRALDPVELERARMHQVALGEVPQPTTVADALVYVTLQELRIECFFPMDSETRCYAEELARSSP